MSANVTWAALLAVVLGACRVHAADARPEGPSAEDVQKAEQRVKEKYPSLNEANAPPLTPVTDEALARAFPGHLFFAAIARQFPVARIVPRGLKTQNLFAVHGDEVRHLTDIEGLEKYFQSHLKPVKDDRTARDVAHAWLVLAPQFVQDGFYQFTVEKDSLKAARSDDGRRATGKTVVTRGGNGQITIALTFNTSGKLTKAAETRKVRPGPRPICQATKLLDPDPVVRRMAEQDLLIMGRAAEGYLAEQRSKAGPALRKAIDRLWERILAEEE